MASLGLQIYYDFLNERKRKKDYETSDFVVVVVVERIMKHQIAIEQSTFRCNWPTLGWACGPGIYCIYSPF